MKAVSKTYIVQNDLAYPVTVVNLTEVGMYVKSEVSFPPDTILDLLISTGNKRLNIAVKVISSTKREKHYLLLRDV